MLSGREAAYIGEGQVGSSTDERYVRTFPFAEETRYNGVLHDDADCVYTLHIVATKTFEQTFFTKSPAIFAIAVFLSFFLTAFVFVLYDLAVFRRQRNLLKSAERTNAIVSNLFPKDVRDRIMADAEQQAANAPDMKHVGFGKGTRKTLTVFGRSGHAQLKELLGDSSNGTAATTIFKTKPIADFFPEVTVMFADLVGFTAWSSTREPAQVFTLLETIYHEFDQIAQRRRVFKVETVGDCYVAVAGLPEYRKDHATIMVSSGKLCVLSVPRLALF